MSVPSTVGLHDTVWTHVNIARRFERLTTVLVVLACVGGCRATESRVSSSPPSNAPANEHGPAHAETQQFAQPPPGENDDSHEESSVPPRVDVASLPPGPVSCSSCGPAPGYPSWQCPDGAHQGGRGPCVKFEDGRCGWIRLVCPAPGSGQNSSNSCSATECGASPSPAQWRCPDGEHSGAFECVRTQDGTCGWTHRRCLQSAPPPPPPTPAAERPPSPRTSCDPLPSIQELMTWEIRVICGPGGGPAQPPRRVALALGDGTLILEDFTGCFRARYRQCLSK